MYKYKALEEEYRRRMFELTEIKEQRLFGRGFPDHTLLEKDDNLNFTPDCPCLCQFYPFVGKAAPDTVNAKLSNYQCFILSLMKLRLNLSNYDLGFRFCIHETTVSRILTNWIQILDVRLSKLVKLLARERKTMPWCFRPNLD